MATSPTHKFGQIIGDLLEMAIGPQLQRFAEEHKLYLDKKCSRPARRGKKVTWIDAFGNSHDLDFVIERGGTDTKIGTPVAFIETAWRRYTKHSRNKAQEIQGAIQPLVIAHSESAPFIGVVLAGDFTEGSLTQLHSLGFKVLYFKYEDVVKSFASVGIDASFDEDTPDEDMYPKIQAWEALSETNKKLLVKNLMETQSENLERFIDSLEKVTSRRVEFVRILPLFGKGYEWHTIDEAISFIQNYNEDSSLSQIVRYEVEIRYNNGDKINGQFTGKASAIQFLSKFNILLPKPAK